jgi:hypothetical protein
MKRSVLVGFTTFIAALSLTSCGSQSSQGTPGARVTASPPSQIIIQPQRDQQQQDDAADLHKRRETIESEMREWSTDRAPLPGEPDVRAKRITEDCDALERIVSEKLRQPSLQEQGGNADDLEDLLKFAKDARDQVGRGR